MLFVDYTFEVLDASAHILAVSSFVGGRKSLGKAKAKRQSKLSVDSNLPRRQTRSRSKSAGGKNDIITIDDSSDEEVSCHMFICSILGQSATN